MNIYQNNISRKDLNWLNFDDEPRSQERQEVKVQQSYIPIFLAYLTFPSSNQENQPRNDNSISWKVVCQAYRDTEQPQEKDFRELIENRIYLEAV